MSQHLQSLRIAGRSVKYSACQHVHIINYKILQILRLQANYDTSDIREAFRFIVDQPNRVVDHSLIDFKKTLIPELAQSGPGTHQNRPISAVNAPAERTWSSVNYRSEFQSPSIVEPQRYPNVSRTFKERLCNL